MSAFKKSSIRNNNTPHIGIIAGSGMLPLALVQKCLDMGKPVAVVALQGFANVNDFAPHLRTGLYIGRGRKIINFFREHNVHEIVLIGAVKRPSFWDIRPDIWTLTRLGPALMRGSLGDDGLLRVVRRVFEHEGFKVQGIQKFLPDLIAATGPIGRTTIADTDTDDIKRGFDVARALGTVDVGQSVVVQRGLVLGVEGVEGTSELIRRCGTLKRMGPGPILVKSSKPGQDRDLDLPTIGPDTVDECIRAGFRGIAVQAGSTLLVEPVKMMARADAADFFIYGHE